MITDDYERIAIDFLRALRGRRSQIGFSRRLGYKSNVSYLWESGRSWPTAAKTLYITSRVGLDPVQAIQSFYHRIPTWLEAETVASKKTIADLLDDLRGGASIQQISDRADKSRFAVSRWLKGETEIRLPDFFLMLDVVSARLLEFIACFVDPQNLPSLRFAWKQRQAAQELVGRHLPWNYVVLLALETESYLQSEVHTTGWLASYLGVSEEVETQCLEVLQATGQIQWVKTHWRCVTVQTVDTQVVPGAGRKLKAWSTQQGHERIMNDSKGLFSFNLFSISDDDYQVIQEMQRAHYRAIRALVANSSPAQHVVALNMHLFTLDVNVSADEKK